MLKHIREVRTRKQAGYAIAEKRKKMFFGLAKRNFMIVGRGTDELLHQHRWKKHDYSQINICICTHHLLISIIASTAFHEMILINQ
jgi:hypothetical protein